MIELNEKLKYIKKLADAMYYAAQYLTTDASRLHKAMDEYHQFIINEYHKEEPVSEELEEAAKNHAVERYRVTRDMVLAEKCKWSFQTGAKWKEKQMMSKAVDAHVNYAWSGLSFGGFDWSKTGLDIGDKCKLIIIKED